MNAQDGLGFLWGVVVGALSMTSVIHWRGRADWKAAILGLTLAYGTWAIIKLWHAWPVVHP